MSRITNFLYGGVITLIALDLIFTGWLPDEVTPFVVMLLGLLVLVTSIEGEYRGVPVGSQYGRFHSGGLVNFIRRWVFGVVLIFIGATGTGIIDQFSSLSNLLGSISLKLDQWPGQVVLLIIGVIYFLAAFSGGRRLGMPTSY